MPRGRDEQSQAPSDPGKPAKKQGQKPIKVKPQPRLKMSKRPSK